tara:strand:+ start:590 stop:892 length:303 start_codon:yes stop_codon:yes gene_type:complete
MAKKSKDLNSYIEEAITNIRDDRNVVGSLLVDLIVQMKKSDENQKILSLAAAKYVETLQRSNEQLVKVAALLQKKHNRGENLTDDDKQELFELIKEAESA